MTENGEIKNFDQECFTSTQELEQEIEFLENYISELKQVIRELQEKLKIKVQNSSDIFKNKIEIIEEKPREKSKKPSKESYMETLLECLDLLLNDKKMDKITLILARQLKIRLEYLLDTNETPIGNSPVDSNLKSTKKMKTG